MERVYVCPTTVRCDGIKIKIRARWRCETRNAECKGYMYISWGLVFPVYLLRVPSNATADRGGNFSAVEVELEVGLIRYLR